MTTLPGSALTQDAQQRAGNDPIFALNAEARARAAGGESIINATLGALTDEEGRLALMASVGEVFASVPSAQAAGYAPISGVPAFLDATIQDLFAGTDLASSAVAVSTPGGTGAVYQAMANFLEPGQSALTTSYYWGPYRVIAGHAGRGIESFPMFDDDGSLDTAALSAAMNRQADQQGRVLLILNFPCHNPTGYSLDADEWAVVSGKIQEVASRAPVAVLLDAAYLRFAAPGAERWLDAVPSMLEAATVLVAWTASKSFTQYGARVGSLVALHRDPAERQRLSNALGYSCRATWSNCNHLGQVAVAQLLTDPDLRARADRERAQLRDMLQARVDRFKGLAQGFAFPRYDGGFFVSVFTPDAERSAECMRADGVYVVPLAGAVRVALCSTPLGDVERMVQSLARGVAAAS